MIQISDGELYIRELEESDARELLELRLKNREFLRPFEPARSEYFFSLDGQKEQIRNSIRKWDEDGAYAFGVFLSDPARMIGRAVLNNVLRGPCCYADLGYFLDRDHNGKGYMTRAVGLVVRYGFAALNLHRIQAGIMPRNAASRRVLQKCGFRYEGLARQYLQINGVWEDHEIYATINDDFT